MKSVILIGMPSSGKTTIGKILAKKIGYKFYDTDKIIEKMMGITIPKYFELYGEIEFRKFESNVIQSLASEKKVVIATGGGAVKIPENFSKFSTTNFVIIYIKRDINCLVIGDKRPLSKSKDDLVKLYNERRELYENLSNYTVINDGIFNTVIKIIKLLKYIRK